MQVTNAGTVYQDRKMVGRIERPVLAAPGDSTVYAYLTGAEEPALTAPNLPAALRFFTERADSPESEDA